MPAAPPNTITEDDAQHRRVLALMIDLGAALAEELAGPAPDYGNEAAPARASAPIRAEAFERVSLTVRRCILLSRHIAQALPIANPAVHLTAIRTRIIREVEDTIHRDARPADAEALRAELVERLETLDHDGDIANRPTAELIAELLRDLGLGHMPGNRAYGRRTPADIARLRLLAALPPGQAAGQVAAPSAAPQPKPSKSPKLAAKLGPTAPDAAGIRANSLLASLLRRPDG